MATEVEKRDSGSKDKPSPAKRQRTAVNSLNEIRQSMRQIRSDNEAAFNEEDKQSREKLRDWQACQAAKCYLDDTINRVLEKYEKSPPLSYHFEDPWYHLFRGNRMEDTAVSMAIRNYGLVRCLDLSHAQSSSSGTLNNPEDHQISIEPLSTIPSASQEIDWDHEKYDSDHQQVFLDRAVAEAIKKKGLSTLSVDYG